MFNLAIDSKLRGCDVVAMREDWADRGREDICAQHRQGHAHSHRRDRRCGTLTIRISIFFEELRSNRLRQYQHDRVIE
jgi:hypothetical protein